MKLYPYQKRCLRQIDKFNGRALVALEQGLGKTPIALRWLKKRSGFPSLIVCPASLKWNWQREAERWIKTKAGVIEGRKGDVPDEPLIIINYDILPFWVEKLWDIDFHGLVIDESQKIMSPTTQRTMAVQDMADGIPHVLALSGTPLLNRPIELFPTLNIVCPYEFPSLPTFGDRFCAPEFTRWGKRYVGISRPKELHRLLKSTCMIRMRKSEVLPELPPKTREVVILPLSKPSMYQEASDDFIGFLAKQDTEKANRAARAVAITRLGYLKRLAAQLKLCFVIEWLNDFLESSDEKIVVFAIQKEIIRTLKEQVKAKSVVVDGSVKGKKREKAVQQFQNDPATRVFIGNIQAAGVGITLTAASTVVFAELDWRPADHTQAEDRCHRIGTIYPVFIYYLVAKETIEIDLCELIQRKQEVLSSVLDGGKQEDTLPIYDKLLQKLRKEKYHG